MASSLPEEDLTCTICWDVFRDPVVLSCSHSICKGCLKNYWSEKEFEKECPLCRRRSSRDDPPVCLPLKNLCEAFSKERARPEEWCAEHSERFKLFCMNDKKFICVVCRDSTQHKYHNCSPIEEAAKTIKVPEIEKALQPLKDKIREFQNTERTCQSMADHIKRQAEKAEPLIKKGFEKLRAFLEEQENKLLNDLKEEEEMKTKLMAEKMDSIGKKITSLSSKIETIKKEMEDMESVTFLRDISVILRSKTLREFEDVLKRPLGDTEEEGEDLSGGLIDMPKHVGNLTFKIWLRMRDICHYSPVLLNPNASGSYMELSDDLTTVENSYGRLSLPNNPERTGCILGSEAINNGLFIWEVQVNKHKYWDIGVIKAKKEKGEDIWSRVCCLRSRTGRYSSPVWHYIGVTGTPTPLALDEPPETVRVVLEYYEGKLSFYDGKGKLLHTLEHKFTGDVLPFYNSYHQTEPVKFLPIKPVVSLEVCDMIMV